MRDTDYDQVENLLRALFSQQAQDQDDDDEEDDEDCPTTQDFRHRIHSTISTLLVLMLNNSNSIEDVEINMSRIDAIKDTYLEKVKLNVTKMKQRKAQLVAELAKLDSAMASINNIGTKTQPKAKK